MKNLGKHQIRIIATLNGVETSNRVQNLILYQKTDGRYYSHVYGGREVVPEQNGEFVVRQKSKTITPATCYLAD